MAEDKNGFIFYPSFIDQIEAIRDEVIKLRLYQAATQYGCFGTIPDFSDVDPLGILDGLFLAIKCAIDNQHKRREAQRTNGAKGGAPMGNTNAKKQPNSTENNLNKDKDKDKNKDKDKDKKELSNESKNKNTVRFSAPSLDEVKKFFLENDFKSDPEKFFYHYEANGWRQSNGLTLKKWELAARGWEKRQDEFAQKRPGAIPKPQPQPTPTAPDYSDTDFGGVQY